MSAHDRSPPKLKLRHTPDEMRQRAVSSASAKDRKWWQVLLCLSEPTDSGTYRSVGQVAKLCGYTERQVRRVIQGYNEGWPGKSKPGRLLESAHSSEAKALDFAAITAKDKSVIVVATSLGGGVDGIIVVTSVDDIRRRLFGGDAAHMANYALKGGAEVVFVARVVGKAIAATLDFGDMRLTSRYPGKFGNATLCERKRLERGFALRIWNQLTKVDETFETLESAAQAVERINQESSLATAVYGSRAPLWPKDPKWFEGGVGGGSYVAELGNLAKPEPLQAWCEALARTEDLKCSHLALGSSDLNVIKAAFAHLERCETLRRPRTLYVGPDYHEKPSKLKRSAFELAEVAARTPHTVRIVCNTVRDDDLLFKRYGEYPAYHLGAYLAGLEVAGRAVNGAPIEVPALGQAWTDNEIAEMLEVGIAPVRSLGFSKGTGGMLVR